MSNSRSERRLRRLSNSIWHEWTRVEPFGRQNLAETVIAKEKEEKEKEEKEKEKNEKLKTLNLLQKLFLLLIIITTTTKKKTTTILITQLKTFINTLTTNLFANLTT